MNAHILAAAAILGAFGVEMAEATTLDDATDIIPPLTYRGVPIFFDGVADRAGFSLVPMHPHKQCANQSKLAKCGNAPELGHIFCKSCRLALGGYDRYNRPASKNA